MIGFFEEYETTKRYNKLCIIIFSRESRKSFVEILKN